MLTSLAVNCQSLLAKRELFINLIDTYNPDIIFGTKSWLKSDILSSEIFPTDYFVMSGWLWWSFYCLPRIFNFM